MLANNILAYSDFLQDAKEPIQIRLAIVKRYQEIKNITQVAKEFKTTRLSVRKWVKRFSGAFSSLRNHSKAPKQPHRQMDSRTEDLLVQFRTTHPYRGMIICITTCLSIAVQRFHPKALSMRYGVSINCCQNTIKRARRRKTSERSKPNTKLLKRFRSMSKSLKTFPTILNSHWHCNTKHKVLNWDFLCINTLQEISKQAHSLLPYLMSIPDTIQRSLPIGYLRILNATGLHQE